MVRQHRHRLFQERLVAPKAAVSRSAKTPQRFRSRRGRRAVRLHAVENLEDVVNSIGTVEQRWLLVSHRKTATSRQRREYTGPHAPIAPRRCGTSCDATAFSTGLRSRPNTRCGVLAAFLGRSSRPPERCRSRPGPRLVECAAIGDTEAPQALHCNREIRERHQLRQKGPTL